MHGVAQLAVVEGDRGLAEVLLPLPPHPEVVEVVAGVPLSHHHCGSRVHSHPTHLWRVCETGARQLAGVQQLVDREVGNDPVFALILLHREGSSHQQPSVVLPGRNRGHQPLQAGLHVLQDEVAVGLREQRVGLLESQRTMFRMREQRARVQDLLGDGREVLLQDRRGAVSTSAATGGTPPRSPRGTARSVSG